MEEKPLRENISQEKPFGVVALYWDETQIEHPEVPFNQILYFQSLALKTCENCKYRVSSYRNMLRGWP